MRSSLLCCLRTQGKGKNADKCPILIALVEKPPEFPLNSVHIFKNKQTNKNFLELLQSLKSLKCQQHHHTTTIP